MQTQTIQEKTKVCALDLSQDLIEYLQQRFDVFEGSLGKKVKAYYGMYDDTCRFLPNLNLPVNIHEYEVFVEDMSRDEDINYKEKDHTQSQVTEGKAYYFYCDAPQTVFNPVCYGSYILSEKIRAQRIRPEINIIFVSDIETVQYTIRNVQNRYDHSETTKTNHEHLHLPQCENICGSQVRLTDKRLSSDIFQSFLNDIHYRVAFELPYKWKSGERIEDDDFCSLLETPTGAVLSFVWLTDDDITIVLPQTTRKKELLQKVFEEMLFRHFSDYFPEVAESAWIKNSNYFLPNQAELLKLKEEETARYEAVIAELDKQIEANNNQYAFLHTLLTASGNELVNATIQFLKWLGFDKVVDKDENLDKPFNEEDIQVDLGDDEVNGNKLLVIEVKGIGGTSTDAECSQIHKVVHRRGKERKAYDVHGLYIVNNEMHKEPLKRSLPPFNETQISDALNDERGLCYTWQLFNLYFNIEAGVITKEEARKSLFDNGLIEFNPNLTLVGTPHKYYQQHTIACIEIDDKEINIGSFFYYCQNGRWQKAKILSIQDNGQSFDKVTQGSYGFGLDSKVPNNVPLYM